MNHIVVVIVLPIEQYILCANLPVNQEAVVHKAKSSEQMVQKHQLFFHGELLVFEVEPARYKWRHA